MNKHYSAPLILAACALAVPSVALAEQFDTNSLNHFSFAARFGFNISGKFKNAGNLTLNPSSRRTPNGDRYNYDNGYVHNDVSGSTDGQTWYWGYDNSARQISGNTILMSRSTVGAGISSGGGDASADPSLGCEFTYNRELGKRDNVHFGIEAAINYMNIGLNDHGTFLGNAFRRTDAYPYTPGTTPPNAPPAYQGSFGGPGFLIGSTPISSATTVIPGGARISGRREFNADVWGFRLGPYLEFPLWKQISVALSGGLAVGLVDGSVSWNETAVITGGGIATGSGKGNDFSVLYGGYLSAKVAWQVSERWSAEGGVQYQLLGNYEHNLGGRTVELDLSKSIFVTLGVGYRF